MNWFFASGDLGFFWNEQIRAFSWLPRVFQTDQAFGFNGLLSLWLDYPFRLVTKLLSTFGLSWFIIEKILWLSVFILAAYSSYRLCRYVIRSGSFAVLSSIIYATNTYMLLIFSGAQLGVAFAYAFSPFVLFKFISAMDSGKRSDVRTSFINGLWFALLISFELRFAYMTLLMVGFYFVIQSSRFGKKYFFVRGGEIILSLIVSAFVQMFWILPTVLASSGVSSLGDQFTNPGMLKFLSFADLSRTISLLHPNWPENFFGKVDFMQPEFLVLPVLAFSSLLSLRINKKETTIKLLFLNLIALIGAFLATGVNNPVSGIFQWMFVHVPGFVMFRDPTKLYLFVAIAFSVLIPYTIQQLTGNSIKKKVFLCIIFIAYWCFTLRPVFLGQMSGNFRPLQLSQEYVRFKNMLIADDKPSRVLWMPAKDAFAYASDIHPLLTSQQLFGNASESAILSMIKQPDFMMKLSDAGVEYVVVPQDLEKRIFLKDYVFDPGERSQLIESLSKTSLKPDNSFTSITVFYNPVFTMKTEIPLLVYKQQKLADIGLVISVVSLIISMGLIVLMKTQ